VGGTPTPGTSVLTAHGNNPISTVDMPRGAVGRRQQRALRLTTGFLGS
jgi:hypothetical protein